MSESESKYDGWLVSNSLAKRALAVAGHQIVAQFILVIPIMLLATCAGILFDGK